MRFLDADAVRAALPMPRAVEVARATFVALAAGIVEQPARRWIQLEQPRLLAGLMPCGVGGDTPVYTVKLVTLVPENVDRGLPSINGIVTLFDGVTGVPTAVLDGGAITAIRTAAVSGLATDLLAAPGAGDLAIIGAGVQGRAHLEAMAAVRTLRRVRVWNRTRPRAEALAEWGRGLGHDVTVVDDIADATRGADLVCVCTNSHEALVHADHIDDGTHLNAVGAFTSTTRELGADLIAGARVVVDDREAAMDEAGDILMAIHDGAIGADHVSADLTELVAGGPPPRREGEVTVFKSVGVSAEDAFAAAAAAG